MVKKLHRVADTCHALGLHPSRQASARNAMCLIPSRRCEFFSDIIFCVDLPWLPSFTISANNL